MMIDGPYRTAHQWKVLCQGTTDWRILAILKDMDALEAHLCQRAHAAAAILQRVQNECQSAQAWFSRLQDVAYYVAEEES
jgi:hypothetical protein